jgi:FMN phosphatase YigB (HAD superfamily)
MKLIIFDWGRTLYDPETGALFPETKPLLTYLQEREYTLAIVALATAGQSKIDERLEIIKNENLSQYFVSIKFAVEDKDKMYVETLHELEVKPGDVVIVDDRVQRGVRWGNENGHTTVWVKRGKFAHEVPDDTTGEPTYIISSIGELGKIL